MIVGEHIALRFFQLLFLLCNCVWSSQATTHFAQNLHLFLKQEIRFKKRTPDHFEDILRFLSATHITWAISINTTKAKQCDNDADNTKSFHRATKVLGISKAFLFWGGFN